MLVASHHPLQSRYCLRGWSSLEATEFIAWILEFALFARVVSLDVRSTSNKLDLFSARQGTNSSILAPDYYNARHVGVKVAFDSSLQNVVKLLITKTAPIFTALRNAQKVQLTANAPKTIDTARYNDNQNIILEATPRFLKLPLCRPKKSLLQN